MKCCRFFDWRMFRKKACPGLAPGREPVFRTEQRNAEECPQPQERDMKLYGFPPSPNTWKVRAVAAQLGLPLDLEFVDLTKPRAPAYLALNPAGRTPTLVDGDFTLWESNAIMQYLASRASNTLW